METNKKLVDLGILSEDEASGVKRVSIVEEPAILLDFRYFGKQYSFVKPSAGETQDEFIGRCIPVLRGEGKPEDQAIAICYSYWEEGFDIDTAGLEPYVDPAIKKKNGKAEAPVIKAILAEKECPMDYAWTKDKYVVETLLKLAEELGTKEEDLKALFEKEFAFANPSAGGSGTSVSEVMNQGDKKLYLYKYEGLITDNSRDFCVGMVGLDNFYTKAQIQAMSDIAVNRGFGIEGASTYSIWQFKGGPNCKHRWVQYLVTMPEGQIQIEEVKNAAGRAGRTPYSMPKHGYYNKAAFKFGADDKMVLVGPAMVPNISIPRVDDDGETYFVRFSAETIKEIAMKYMKEARTNDVNTDHEENTAGAYIYESWIVETPDDKANTVYGYDVPVGTWMIAMKVDDKNTWDRIKAGELRGFSIEGILVDMEELEAKKKYERIKQILR
jgi:ferredoxin